MFKFLHNKDDVKPIAIPRVFSKNSQAKKYQEQDKDCSYWTYSHKHIHSLTLSQTTNSRQFQIERVCRRQF